MIVGFLSRTAARFVLPLALLSALCIGCSIRQVTIDPAGLTAMSASNVPTTRATTRIVVFHPMLTGRTCTFPYAAIPWQFARMPCIQADDGDMVMLDTGWNFTARVTLDIIRDRHIPVHMGKSINFAYVKSLALKSVTAREFPVVADTQEWQLLFFNHAIFKARGWTLGTTLLAQAAYLECDSRDHLVTIGFDTFTPSHHFTWTSYPMTTPRPDTPYVRLTVAGKALDILADSACGPHMILNRPQWDILAPGLKIDRHFTDEYASWDGMQPVDVYIVRDLSFGPLHLKNEPIWVRRDKQLELDPCFGLGILANQAAVWDFKADRFWIGE